jgi:tetratricopeptide (TPR) repeat protein
MKKTVYILILIVLAVYIIFSVVSAGGEYAAEKIFYRAMKANAKITANPNVVPPKLIEYVETNLKDILKKYPKTDVARAASITLAEIYIYNKRYDDALSTSDSIIKTYSSAPAILSTAHFLKGQVYEKQDKWAKALKEYNIVRNNYTDTVLGIHMPLYVAKYYAGKGRDADARQAYSEAVLFYGKLEKVNSRKMLGYTASKLLIQVYMDTGNYEEAGRVLEETINNYRSGITLEQLLPQVENVFVIKLKQPDKAIEIYKSIKEKFKDERLNKFLDKKIAAIKE